MVGNGYHERANDELIRLPELRRILDEESYLRTAYGLPTIAFDSIRNEIIATVEYLRDAAEEISEDVLGL